MKTLVQKTLGFRLFFILLQINFTEKRRKSSLGKRRLHSHSNRWLDGEPGVWEKMSGGDMSTAGEGSIVAGIGVDVDIAPPNTVRVGKEQKEELAGMNYELNRKLRELQRSNWSRSQN